MRGTGYAIMSILMIAVAVAVLVVALTGPSSALNGSL
jgi:hypothetical protein